MNRRRDLDALFLAHAPENLALRVEDGAGFVGRPLFLFRPGAWQSTWMSGSLWYFAYGSNLSRQTFVERRGMQPASTAWGWLDGWRLCFDLPVGPGERGVANVVPEEGSRTCGVLYLISAEEAERLDRSEGVFGSLYSRVEVQVSTQHGENLYAFTYHSSYSSPGRKPSPRYIGLLLQGALEHGLPAEYVAFLRRFELAHDERPEHER
jgi:cation transport regulator ChaC